MWILLIPAAVIIGAWAWGASKVAENAPPLPTNPPGTPTPKPITIDEHGTGVGVPVKKGDTVIGDFGNAKNVRFLVIDALTPESPFIMVQMPTGGIPIQMPRDSITNVIPA